LHELKNKKKKYPSELQLAKLCSGGYQQPVPVSHLHSLLSCHPITEAKQNTYSLARALSTLLSPDLGNSKLLTTCLQQALIQQ